MQEKSTRQSNQQQQPKHQSQLKPTLLVILFLFPIIAAVFTALFYNNITTITTTDKNNSMTAARVSRTVIQAVLAREQAEGVGATVRRSIGTAALRNFTPFLMLDNFKVAEGAGFPDHPHRGMTTLTYLIRGEFEHEDFVGHKGHLGPGDVQFMIAGKGIVHAEMPVHKKGGEDPYGLQLWIDLPKQYKMVDPSYQELKASEIPSANPSPHVAIKVVCGTAEGSPEQGEKGMVSSPIRSLGGCWFIDFVMSKKGESVWQAVPKGWNTFIYTLEGTIKVSDREVPTFHTAVLSNSDTENGVLIEQTSETNARFVVVSGEPLDQEIVQHGPFVMDSRVGIQKAFQDYSLATNGFEGAHDWSSEIGAKMK